MASLHHLKASNETQNLQLALSSLLFIIKCSLDMNECQNAKKHLTWFLKITCVLFIICRKY